MVAVVGSSLGRTSPRENRRAALQAMFDTRFDDQIRNELVARWVRDSDYPHRDQLSLFSEAFETADHRVS